MRGRGAIALLSVTASLLIASQPLAAEGDRAARGGNPPERDDPTAAAPSPTPSVVSGLTREVRELRSELSSFREETLRREDPPPWAVRIHRQLDRRIERLAVLEERIAARIETPVPRLDEPIILFTVATSTLILGVFLGRTIQRRSSRRDGRLRL